MTEHEQTADAIRKRRADQLGLAHASLAERMRYWPHVQGDLPAYESPITGKLIQGRRARREDLKHSGCIEYDPGMKADAMRNHAANEAKLDAAISETVETIFNQLPSDKRRQLEREADMIEKFDRRR